MFERLRRVISDTLTELRGHRELTRDIKAQIAGGDQEAAETFRTGTLRAALTWRGCCARGEEVARYVRLVMDADGTADRVAWLHR
ncbi:hypothetical protein [Kitasatospora cathayae]|uniref:Uncharacterized protein n=1 Tax=Kitasatospora cathayae TaxID=3004092 RepID=A0ABY7QGR4_9ACTN|nr:hypothetical protein [Kitasatospora sp. HUAS 3-15]WBP91981.1 hypothetical protein O1G21_40025 [Kitasatospora sp. HUAS 3-15]